MVNCDLEILVWQIGVNTAHYDGSLLAKSHLFVYCELETWDQGVDMLLGTRSMKWKWISYHIQNYVPVQNYNPLATVLEGI